MPMRVWAGFGVVEILQGRAMLSAIVVLSTGGAAGVAHLRRCQALSGKRQPFCCAGLLPRSCTASTPKP